MDEPTIKESLYGEFLAGEKRRARIYERGARKALDLADDEMNIETRIEKNGVGVAGVVALAAAFGIPATIASAALAWFAMQPSTPPATPPTSSPPAADVDTDSTLWLLDRRPQ